MASFLASNILLTRSESGSFSEQSLHLHPPEDSLSVNFVDSSVSKSRSVHVPFTLYDKSDSNQRTSNLLDWDYENSVSVIFEDSGCAEKSTTEELSLSSSTSNCDVPQNVVMMEQGVRRPKSRSRSHRRSKSCDSVSSRKLGKSKLSKSFDDTWTMSKHKPPENLDIFTTRDEINKKDIVAPTPTRKLYLYIQMQLCQRATLKDWMIQNSEHREPATLLDILDQTSVLWTTYTALDWCIEISRWATWLLFALLSFFYTPRFNEVERGVYWYHLVRLSFCGQNRVRSVSSTILIGSISYLHILSSNLRRWVACNAGFKIQKFEILANFLNL